MRDYESLLQLYREDPLFIKIEEVYNKWKHHARHKKIVKSKRDIYLFKLNDKFIMFSNILLECLFQVDFKAKDCFKFFMVIYKNLQRNGSPFMTCKKMYLVKQVKINRMTLHRSISELEEKNMLLVERIDNDFKFTLNLAPLSWNLSEGEKQNVDREIEKEIDRLHRKWIEGDD
jgi:hypothetical protein